VSTRFVRDRAFERELQAEPEFKAFMDNATVSVADMARDLAPEHTGYYKRRIRAIGRRVRTLDPFDFLIEFGSKNNPAYAPLRRAVRAAGLRFRDARHE
jgi:hypothetical protein